MNMLKYLLFGTGSLILVVISWRSLFNLKSHGFIRFFGEPYREYMKRSRRFIPFIL